MRRTAINIVLLPSKEMTNEVIKLNKELLKTNKPKIILGNVINLPHISLCMGGINKEDLPEIINIINEVSINFTTFNFESKLSIQNSLDNEMILWLEIKKNNTIQKLHEVVMKSMWNYLSYNIDSSMLVNPKEVEEKTISWIKHYSNLYKNPSLFQPHITIGVGDITRDSKIFNFSSSSIAIFKLGNYCTCNELIYKTNLN